MDEELNQLSGFDNSSGGGGHLLVRVRVGVKKWTRVSAWPLAEPRASVWQHVTGEGIEEVMAPV